MGHLADGLEAMVVRTKVRLTPEEKANRGYMAVGGWATPEEAEEIFNTREEVALADDPHLAYELGQMVYRVSVLEAERDALRTCLRESEARLLAIAMRAIGVDPDAEDADGQFLAAIGHECD